jgi:acetylornithine deacetylase/succinyl-diaminopimelate desuccinylase-like protein
MTIAAGDVDAAVRQGTSAVTEGAILEAVDLFMEVPSPPGRERRLAEHIAARCRRAHPELECGVDLLDDASANMVARSVLAPDPAASSPSHRRAGASAHPGRAPLDRELAVYGHLDTSLTGEEARDFPITGEVRDPAPYRFDTGTRTLRGLGIGVAKAPSAAAAVAFIAAAAALRSLDAPHRLALLLAAGGTHRAVPSDRPGHAVRFGRGVAHAIARGWRPSAILNVKGGPPGVLHEEPSTAYLRVRLRSRWTAALVRAKVAPEGGLVRHAGVVLDAIESWRTEYLEGHPPSGQLANEIAVGAVRGGSPEKADLIPGLLEAFVYAILPPAEDPGRVAGDLERHLRPRVADLPGAPTVEVEAYASAPGGRTDPSHEIVRLAREAWRVHIGTGADQVHGWTGATDGGLLMAAGIPTARMGAYVKRDPDDPRIEIVSMDELLASARAWVEVAIRYCAA